MATYVTLQSKNFGNNPWHKVLRVLPEQGAGCEALVQLMSLNGDVSVVSVKDIDKIAKDGDIQ